MSLGQAHLGVLGPDWLAFRWAIPAEHFSVQCGNEDVE